LLPDVLSPEVFMRRTLLALTIVASALLIAACSSASPGWTYAPPTVPPPSQPAPSGEATVAPQPTPVESAAPSAGTGGGGDVVQIAALNIAWEQTEVSAPAGKPFTIHFNNKDAGIPHNVAIKDASGMEMFKGDIVTGPIETDYKVPALAAGTYQFVCTVHPNMVGTLKVGG
jgi:plastocyanin